MAGRISYVAVGSRAGAGILNLGNLVVENSTFVNNSAVDHGGALFK